MKKAMRRLTLARETLRDLDSRQVAVAQGGVSDPCTTTTGSDNCTTSVPCPPTTRQTHNTCGSFYC